MLEYRWLFALLLRSARCFTGAEGKWTPLPPISPPSSLFSELHFLSEEVSETQEAQTTGNFCEDRHNRSCNGSGSSHTGCCTRALGLSLGKTCIVSGLSWSMRSSRLYTCLLPHSRGEGEPMSFLMGRTGWKGHGSETMVHTSPSHRRRARKEPEQLVLSPLCPGDTSPWTLGSRSHIS